jgi:hypothetical protein
LRGSVAAQRANSIIFIILVHKGDSGVEVCWRKPWVASRRLVHSATFVFCSICPLGPSWGSFGGMKTCSMTEYKTESGPWVTGAGMTVDNETADVADKDDEQTKGLVYEAGAKPPL